MGIIEAPFNNEGELEEWVIQNLHQFFGDCISLDKTRIQTASGKYGIPDGFAFNFEAREWHLIECELLSHGVWSQIAEQITRFVVALQNQDSIRLIRDSLFETVIGRGEAERIAKQLGYGVERLHQQLELFLNGIQPSVSIFIDETNQDINEFAQALQIPIRIYRIKKLKVNGLTEYYSPDQSNPAIATLPEEKATEGTRDFDVIDQLGGGVVCSGERGFKYYELQDGRVVHIKRSKFHEQNRYYWYGLNPNSLDQAESLNVSHMVFVLGSWGFAVVPIKIVKDFCSETKVSKNPDGSIRHYHLLISPEPELEIYWSNEISRFGISEYCEVFE